MEMEKKRRLIKKLTSRIPNPQGRKERRTYAPYCRHLYDSSTYATTSILFSPLSFCN